MQIKRFEAKDMTDALKMVKKEFGPEAVILSARNLEKGRGLLGILKRGGVEVTAAMDPASLNKGAQAPVETPVEPVNGTNVNGNGGGYRYANLPVKPPRRPAARALPDGEMRELAELHQVLIRQDVKESLAWNLIGEMSRCSQEPCILPHQAKAYLVEALQNKGVRARPFRARNNRQRYISLLGPAGVGKTTTIAKLAILHRLNLKKRVGLVVLDDERIGGGEQLKVYARIIGVPIEVVRESESTHRALGRLRECDLVLMDTAGIGLRDRGRMRRLRERLCEMPNVENQLLISASMREQDMVAVINHFAEIPIHGLIFTKLDESRAYGAIINQLLRYRIPVTYMTNGQQVPEDLLPATMESLAELIMQPEKPPFPEKLVPVEPQRIAVQEPEPVRQPSGFIANRTSDVFHHPQCRWAAKIKDKNIVHFRDREEAMEMNYKPCKMCLSDEEDTDGTDSEPLKIAGVTG